MECGQVLEELTDYFSPKQKSYLHEYILLELWLSESNTPVYLHLFLPEIISCLALLFRLHTMLQEWQGQTNITSLSPNKYIEKYFQVISL